MKRHLPLQQQGHKKKLKTQKIIQLQDIGMKMSGGYYTVRYNNYNFPTDIKFNKNKTIMWIDFSKCVKVEIRKEYMTIDSLLYGVKNPQQCPGYRERGYGTWLLHMLDKLARLLNVSSATLMDSSTKRIGKKIFNFQEYLTSVRGYSFYMGNGFLIERYINNPEKNVRYTNDFLLKTKNLMLPQGTEDLIKKIKKLKLTLKKQKSNLRRLLKQETELQDLRRETQLALDVFNSKTWSVVEYSEEQLMLEWDASEKKLAKAILYQNNLYIEGEHDLPIFKESDYPLQVFYKKTDKDFRLSDGKIIQIFERDHAFVLKCGFSDSIIVFENNFTDIMTIDKLRKSIEKITVRISELQKQQKTVIQFNKYSALEYFLKQHRNLSPSEIIGKVLNEYQQTNVVTDQDLYTSPEDKDSAEIIDKFRNIELNRSSVHKKWENLMNEFYELIKYPLGDNDEMVKYYKNKGYNVETVFDKQKMQMSMKKIK